MLRSLVRALLLSVLVCVPVAAFAQSQQECSCSEREQASPADQQLKKLLATEWDYYLEHNPTEASILGDRRWNDQWPDLSLGSLSRQYQHSQQVLEQMQNIDRSQLSPSDQVNFEMYKRQLEEGIEEYEYHGYLIPLNQREGIQTEDELAQSIRFETAKDYQDWIARLKSFPAYMDQTIALLQEGIKEGIVHPEVIMERIPGQIDKQLVAPEKSGFYLPFRRFPASFSPQEQQQFAAEGKQAIEQDVLPAFRRFKQFFVTQYLPHTYDRAGVWQWPNGDKYYQFTVRKYTTTNLTPEQIHRIGLSEVKRIHAEMQKVKEQTGFNGSMQEFFHFLRTDPRFYYKTGEELLEGYRNLAKTVDPKLVTLFKILPRMPYGVKPIPMNVAPDTTTAYYFQGAADGSRAGTYFVNLYKPETRPKWEMTALTLHESVPGHHLQISLGMELGNIPKFRRYGYYSAFGEGWGLYAESLGEQMGLYDDPYAKFGELTYEMWRAVRLVVDTGIHYKHWTRKQAIDYFMENAAKNELDVTNEVDRYIAWPGQALSYMIGSLTIKRLRDEAKEELGDNFDIREFHNVVLGAGATPLDILEHRVREWIELKKREHGPLNARK